MNRLVALLLSLQFWGFVVIKAMGTTFAAWSWWWVLFTFIPWIGVAVKHFGL